MEHIVLPNVAQNEYMIARNLHSSYIGVNVLEACNMAIVLYITYSVHKATSHSLTYERYKHIIHFKTSHIDIIKVSCLWKSFL